MRKSFKHNLMGDTSNTDRSRYNLFRINAINGIQFKRTLPDQHKTFSLCTPSRFVSFDKYYIYTTGSEMIQVPQVQIRVIKSPS
jgi:hypothetical protein